MTVRFLRDYTVQGRDGTTYAEGEVRDDLSPQSEQHFINRNVAERAEKGAKSEPAESRSDSAEQAKQKRGRRASR